VRAGHVERVEQAGGVGDQVAQGVLRGVGIPRRGVTGVAEVVPDDPPRACGKPLAEIIFPGERCRGSSPAGPAHW
jgi:hypothetical protein